MALGITKAEVPAGTLAKDVVKDVKSILTKACPRLPTKKKMKELDMDDEQPLYVLTDGEDEDQPFDPEESVVFAEMLFLSEDDCDASVEAAMQALEAAGYEAGIMDVDEGAPRALCRCMGRQSDPHDAHPCRRGVHGGRRSRGEGCLR